MSSMSALHMKKNIPKIANEKAEIFERRRRKKNFNIGKSNSFSSWRMVEWVSIRKKGKYLNLSVILLLVRNLISQKIMCTHTNICPGFFIWLLFFCNLVFVAFCSVSFQFLLFVFFCCFVSNCKMLYSLSDTNINFLKINLTDGKRNRKTYVYIHKTNVSSRNNNNK